MCSPDNENESSSSIVSSNVQYAVDHILSGSDGVVSHTSSSVDSALSDE
jgi:hypothetical protein